MKASVIQNRNDLKSFEEYFEGMDIDFLLSQVAGGVSSFGSVGTAGTAGTAGGTFGSAGTAGTFGSGSSSMCMGTGSG